jgi:hypothetical protein
MWSPKSHGLQLLKFESTKPGNDKSERRQYEPPLLAEKVEVYILKEFQIRTSSAFSSSCLALKVF